MIASNISKSSLRYTGARCASVLADRVKRPDFLNRVKTAEQCIPEFKDGMTIGMSGFTPVGYPKAVPIALCEHVEKNKLQGKLQFTLLSGASLGGETEDRMASLEMITRRHPYQTGKNISSRINNGKMKFADIHLSEFPQLIEMGYFNTSKTASESPVDIALVEATEILADGSIILGGSVGATPEIVRSASKVIIEVNTSIPSYKGMHDIFMNYTSLPRMTIPIRRVDERAGTWSLPISTDKVIAIVES
jgi:acetyl-CoA hydrolase